MHSMSYQGTALCVPLLDLVQWFEVSFVSTVARVPQWYTLSSPGQTPGQSFCQKFPKKEP